MKKSFTNLVLRKMIQPLVFLFFFLALVINVNAQVISSNTITAPTPATSCGAFDPNAITGAVATQSGGTNCGTVSYKWQSASDAAFTADLTDVGTSQDYNPPSTSATTYFRRIASFTCDPSSTVYSDTSSTVTITVNALPSVSAIADGASTVCVNAETPAFTNATAGGTWSIVAGTGTASITAGGVVTGLTAGTVTVTYTTAADGNGCINSTTASLTVNAIPSAPTGTTPQTLCAANVTVASLTATGTAIQWYADASGGTALATSTLLADTNYYYATQTVNGCESSNRFQVRVKALPTRPVISGNTVVCLNDVTIYTTPIVVNGSAYNYNWNVSSTSVGNITNAGTDGGNSFASIKWISIPTGTAYCKVTAINSCGSTASLNYTVTINPLPQAQTLNPTAQYYCHNTSGATLTLNGSQTGIKYFLKRVSDGEIVTPSGVAGTGSAITFTDIQVQNNSNTAIDSTQYYVTAESNAAACVEDMTGTVWVYKYALVTPGTIGTAQSICYNVTPTALTNLTLPTGGNGTFQYQWQSSLDNTNWGDISGATSAGYAPGALNDTTYYRRATYNNCIEYYYTPSVKITVNPQIITGITKIDASCNGATDGSADLTVSGGKPGFTYSWTNGGGTSQDLSGKAAGTYVVTVTDAASCTTTNSVTITEPVVLSASVAKTDVTCNGANNGTITVSSPAGGYGTYEYRLDLGTWQSSGSFTDLAPATYSVQIRDAAHITCVITLGNQIINEPVVLSATVAKTDVTCYNSSNGTITVTSPAGGHGSYKYRLDAGTWQSSGSFTGLAPATYSVQIQDSAYPTCIITLGSQTITQPDAIGATVNSADVTCNGLGNGTITLSAPFGGSGSYEYSINGIIWQSSGSFIGLTPATYSVFIRDSLVTACAISLGSKSILEPVVLGASIVGTDVTCFGLSTGAADLTPTGGNGGNTFLWSNAAVTEDLTGLAAGTYTVTVTDTKGCTATAGVIIGEPNLLIIPGYTADSVRNVSCRGGNDGAVYITPIGGNGGNTFLWSPGGGKTEDTTGLVAGTYSVMVTDSKGCWATASAIVTQPAAALSASIIGTDLSCNGDNTGAANLTVLGGTSPYYYAWTGPSSYTATTEDLTGRATGTYSVIVTDAKGCTTSAGVTLNQPNVLNASIAGTNINCYGGSTGVANLTVTGGTTNYTYSWTKSPSATVIGTTEDLSGLTIGTYNVTVTDAHSCTATATVTITQLNALSATTAKTNVTCNGFDNGTITISNPQGGSGSYEYTINGSSWSTTVSYTGLAPANYNAIYIRDAANPTCIVSLTSQNITQPAVLDIPTASITHINCFGYNTGAIDINVTGGTTPYTYSWSNGSTTQDLTGLAAGTYTITVTDLNLCTAVRTLTVNDAASWQPIVDVVNETDNFTTACQNTSIDYHVTNGATGSTFEWIVTGGTVTAGANTDHVTILWGNGPIGTMKVIETRTGGCDQTSVEYQVTILATPTPVITGLTTVSINQTAVAYTTPYNAGHLYTWVVNGGVITDGIGTDSITVTWGATAGTGTVSVTETNTLGCSGTTTINVTIQNIGYSVSGYVTYNNDPYFTPLNGVTVNLMNNGTVLATTTTGPNFGSGIGELGYYSFDNVPNGNYTINATYNGTFGGNNATDALIVQLNAIGSYPLTGINATVADVNASTTITALDALYIKLRTVGSISTYPAGNWKFETPAITIAEANGTVSFKGLCVGDVNASYIPLSGSKATESYLSTIADNTISIEKGKSFNYNIKSDAISNLGAMTLMMKYNENLFEIENVNSMLNGFKYEVKNGEVSIAWSDMMGNSLKNEGSLVSFTLKAKETLASETEVFSVLSSTEFADVTANIINNVNLKLAKVITANQNGFSVNNYPNPFSNETKIFYTIPENSSVKITLTNIVGQSIATITEEVKTAGSYNVEINANEFNLKNGIYFYKIEVKGITTSYVRTNKLVLEK